MPSRDGHLGKSKSFLRAVLALLEQERPHTYIDPLATLAYYVAMHAFEACFAEGLGSTKRHYTVHEDRIDAVLMNAETYGSKPGTSLSALYDFSRSARYCQDKRQPQGRQRRREAHMGQDFATVDEVLRRLDRCVSKVRSLLGCSAHDLPPVEWKTIKDDVRKRIGGPKEEGEDDPPGGGPGTLPDSGPPPSPGG